MKRTLFGKYNFLESRIDNATFYRRHLEKKSKKNQISEGIFTKKKILKLKNQIGYYWKKYQIY